MSSESKPEESRLNGRIEALAREMDDLRKRIAKLEAGMEELRKPAPPGDPDRP